MISVIQRHEAEVSLQDLTKFYLPGNFIARQRRQKHYNSQSVFPVSQKEDNDYKTHYALQFCSKPKGRPSSPRPCSPTRRNNPHPSKDFLNWRIPTRVYDFGDKKEANIRFLKSNIADTHQSFYSDYIGRPEKENEIGAMMFLEIGKSYDRAIRNATLYRKNDRDNSFNCTITDVGTKNYIMPTLGKFWSVERSFKGHQVKKNLEKATASLSGKQRDQQTFFQTTHLDKTDDELVKMALENALKPDAIEAIRKWLGNAITKDKEIALEFIKAIILASNDVDSQKTRKKSLVPDMNRCNIIVQSPCCISTDDKQQQNKKRNQQQQLSNYSQAQQLEIKKLEQLENDLHREKSSISERMHPDTQQGKQIQFGRKIYRPRQKSFRFNKGALFVTSKKKKSKHYTIHPEWQ